MSPAQIQATNDAATYALKYGGTWEPYLVEKVGRPGYEHESWGIRQTAPPAPAPAVIETVPYNGPVPTTEIPLALPQTEESYVSNAPLLIFDSDEFFPGGSALNDSGTTSRDAFEISRRAREDAGESGEKRAGKQTGKKGQAQKGAAKRKAKKRKPAKRKA